MGRIRYPNRDPMRKVVQSRCRGGRVTVMMPVKSRWWALTLECGHEVERSARYQHQGGQNRGWAALWHPPGLSQMLPAPKRARCEFCPKVEEFER